MVFTRNINNLVGLAESTALFIKHDCGSNQIESRQSNGGEAIEEVYYAHFEKILNRLASWSAGNALTEKQNEAFEDVRNADFGELKGIFVLTNGEYTSFGHFCPFCGKSEAKGPLVADKERTTK